MSVRRVQDEGATGTRFDEDMIYIDQWTGVAGRSGYER